MCLENLLLCVHFRWAMTCVSMWWTENSSRLIVSNHNLMIWNQDFLYQIINLWFEIRIYYIKSWTYDLKSRFIISNHKCMIWKPSKLGSASADVGLTRADVDFDLDLDLGLTIAYTGSPPLPQNKYDSQYSFMPFFKIIIVLHGNEDRYVQKCRLMRCMLVMIRITKCPQSYKVTKTHKILSNMK